jgi:PAS domain S-box-containing protein
VRAFRFGLAAVFVAVEAIVALALIFSTDSEDNPWITAGFAVTAGVLFAVSGLVAMWRRPDNATGLLLAAVGYTWFLGALTAATNDWVFTVGYVFSGTAFVAFTALALAFPSGRLARGAERWVVAGAAILLIGSSLLEAMLTADPASDCDSCAQSTIVVVEAPDAARAVEVVTEVLGLALIATITIVLVRRWRRASAALRRVLGPVLAAFGATLLVLSVSIAADAVNSSWERPLSAVFLAVFATVPLAFLFGVLRTRLAQSAAATVVASLRAGLTLRETLAGALNDPSLDVVYWLEARSIWVEADGTKAATPTASADRSVRFVEQDGRATAALLHDPALDQEPGLLETVVQAAALALGNEGLRAALRAQYLFLETITDTAPSLLIAVGLDGRILNQNQAAVTAAGYDDEEELRGQLFWDAFIDPSEREGTRDRFFGAAPDHPPGEHENAFVNRRGDRYVIAWRSAPLVDDDGAVISIISGGTDITDRKARELELRRERDATTTVLMSIPSVVVVLDCDLRIRDRDVDNPLAAVNRAFREALGWRDEDLVHRSFLELVDPAGIDVAVGALERAAAGSASDAVETAWRKSDGDRVFFQWTAAPIADVTGRTDRLVLVSGTDVTDRRRHEEEVRASRARIVRAADDARRRLERNLHDGAQQRLVSLSLSLRLVQTKLKDDPEGAAAALAASRDELASALEELRELARGIHPAVLTDRGLAAAIEALVARSPVPVTADVPDLQLDPVVEAAVYYVVSESLANVAKYAQAETVAVQAAVVDGVVNVSVTDDGVGGADPAAGSGLRGLADRLAALDGSLVVDSPEGAGTRVHGEIPLRTRVVEYG